MSPETIFSPIFFNHFATLPSVIVGDRAGINKAIGIDPPLH